MDRHHYQGYSLTLARHPSETDERMLVRLLAFALNANQSLSFTKGLSSDSEPDLWQRSLSDEIELWIELGQLDEKRIRRACGKAKQVIIYLYADRSATVWWEQNRDMLNRFSNLRVVKLTVSGASQLEVLAQRNMQLNATIQESQVWLSDENQAVMVEVSDWL